jgi:hypothetical protein
VTARPGEVIALAKHRDVAMSMSRRVSTRTEIYSAATHPPTKKRAATLIDAATIEIESVATRMSITKNTAAGKAEYQRWA